MADTQVVGGGDHVLTWTELVRFSQVAREVESLGPTDDVHLQIEVEGVTYKLGLGWDETGTFGLLMAHLVNEA